MTVKCSIFRQHLLDATGLFLPLSPPCHRAVSTTVTAMPQGCFYHCHRHATGLFLPLSPPCHRAVSTTVTAMPQGCFYHCHRHATGLFLPLSPPCHRAVSTTVTAMDDHTRGAPHSELLAKVYGATCKPTDENCI